MPFVHIEWLEGRSEDQRREVVEVFARELARIADAPLDAINIVVTDVPRTHWSKAGQLMSDS